MFTTLIAGLALAQPPQVKPAAPLPKPETRAQTPDGTWAVLSWEKNGQAVADVKGRAVVIRNGVATFRDEDGTPQKSVKFEFAPNGRVRATEEGTDDGPKTGVYVLTGEFFVVSLHSDPADATPTTRPVGADVPPLRPVPPAAVPPAAVPPAKPPVRSDSPPAAGVIFEPKVPMTTPYCVLVLKRADAKK